MLSVCSFNGVKIGWWPHASPALNFSQKKTIRSYLFCFFLKLGALRKMKRWTLGAWVWTWCVWFSTLIKVLNGLRYRSWWKLICGQQQQDERNRRRTGDPVFFLMNYFLNVIFFSLLCGFLYQKQQRVEIERNPDSDFWLISTVSVVTMASKVAIVFRLLQNSYLQTPIILLLFFFFSL